MYGVTSDPAFFTTSYSSVLSATCVPVKTRREVWRDIERKEEQKPTREEEMAVSEQTALDKIARIQNNPELMSKAGRKMELLPGMEACSGFSLSCLECLRFERNLWDRFKVIRGIFFKNKIAFAFLNKRTLRTNHSPEACVFSD